jgi:biotin carboxyl carrier protein
MSSQVIAPLPGVFYRRPGPDKAPFVEVGDLVTAGQTIGLIEIMKQFNEVRTEAGGTLSAFLAEDNGMVSPGDVIATLD